MNEQPYTPVLADALGLAKVLAEDITALVDRVSPLEDEVAELKSKSGRIGWSND